jgi:WD40 repeat protein
MTYNWNSGLTGIWDPDTFEPLGVPFTDEWSAFTVSPDGRFAAFGQFWGDVRVYDVRTGDTLLSSTALGQLLSGLGRGAAVIELRFTWDSSKLVALGGRGGIGVWDTETWDFHRFVDHAEGEPEFTTVGVSRDGALLAAGDADGRITLFDTTTWQPIEVLEGGPNDASPFIGTHGLRFTEDDRYLIMTGTSEAQLFSVACSTVADSGQCAGRGRIGGPWAGEPMEQINPSPTGRHFVTATADHLLVWEVAPDRWVDEVCAAAGRRLSEEEWQIYVGDEPYDPVC